MAHDHKPVTVWTLKHRTEGNWVTVALPLGYIPDDDEWELAGAVCQTISPRHDSTDSTDS